jgi:hypothetical protein
MIVCHFSSFKYTGLNLCDEGARILFFPMFSITFPTSALLLFPLFFRRTPNRAAAHSEENMNKFLSASSQVEFSILALPSAYQFL